MKTFSGYLDGRSNFSDDYHPFALMAVLYYLVVSLFMILAGFMEPTISHVELYLSNLFEGLYYATKTNSWIEVGTSTTIALLISAYMIYRYETRGRRTTLRATVARSQRKSGGSPRLVYGGSGLSRQRIPAIMAAKTDSVIHETEHF